MNYFFHLSRFLGEIIYQIELNSGLEFRNQNVIMLIKIFRFILDLLDVNLPEVSQLLSAQMTILSIFFQEFILLGMYNFVTNLNLCRYLWQKRESQCNQRNHREFAIIDVELLRNCSKISKLVAYLHYGSSNYVHKDVRLANCNYL